MNYHEMIVQFYTALDQRDHQSLNALYHDEAVFEDEVFKLKGKEIQAMWHMLCTNGKDLRVNFEQVEVSANTGSANWIANYTFRATERKVTNFIAASFIFKDDKIYRHTDHFDFWNWSHQAFGIPGLLMGWTSFFRNKVKEKAALSLSKFIKSHPEYIESPSKEIIQ